MARVIIIIISWETSWNGSLNKFSFSQNFFLYMFSNLNRSLESELQPVTTNYISTLHLII